MPVVLSISVPLFIVKAGQLTVMERVVLPVQPFASVALMVKFTGPVLAVGVPWSWPALVMLSQPGAPLSE